VARFRKKTIGTGGYQTPGGAQAVDPARLKHWADTITEMVKLGIKPPLSWGHSKGALPHGDADAEFWRSRLVAGKLLGARVGRDGLLEIEADAPGVDVDAEGRLTTLLEHDGRKLKSAIEEVSIGAMDWTDGTGRVWRDAPVHVALTPLPVWVPEGGQPPFEPINEAGQNEPGVVRFSTASLLYRFASEGAVADEEKKESPPEKDVPDKKDGEGDGEIPEVGLPEVLEALASIGLTLPESTTDMTLMRDIVVGCAAIAGASGETQAEETPATPADDGGMGIGSGGGGAFMSTLMKDPLGMGLIARLEGEDRNKRLERLSGFSRRGLPAHQAKKLREQITAAKFSTDASGNPLPAAVDAQLDLLDSVLPPEGESVHAALFGAGVPTPPEGDEASAKKQNESLADQMARAGGLPSRKRA